MKFCDQCYQEIRLDDPMLPRPSFQIQKWKGSAYLDSSKLPISYIQVLHAKNSNSQIILSKKVA